MLGNQEKSSDDQEDDQGDVRLGLHRAIVVRFMLVFHNDILWDVGVTYPNCRVSLSSDGDVGHLGDRVDTLLSYLARAFLEPVDHLLLRHVAFTVDRLQLFGREIRHDLGAERMCEREPRHPPQATWPEIRLTICSLDN